MDRVLLAEPTPLEVRLDPRRPGRRAPTRAPPSRPGRGSPRLPTLVTHEVSSDTRGPRTPRSGACTTSSSPGRSCRWSVPGAVAGTGPDARLPPAAQRLPAAEVAVAVLDHVPDVVVHPHGEVAFRGRLAGGLFDVGDGRPRQARVRGAVERGPARCCTGSCCGCSPPRPARPRPAARRGPPPPRRSDAAPRQRLRSMSSSPVNAAADQPRGYSEAKRGPLRKYTRRRVLYRRPAGSFVRRTGR